jgi:uncharacterized protein (TIGR00725 family)
MITNSTSPGPQRWRLVAVIGDASVPPGSQNDLLAEEVGRLLVDVGFRVLTGGLGGVMEAACHGARSSTRYQAVDTVAVLPGHDPADANPFVDVVIASGLDHVRNSIIAHADAVIAIGGGAGTMSEICLAWICKRLIVALRVAGWSGKLADQRVDERVRYPDEKHDRVFRADTHAEAVRILADQVGRYSSLHRSVRRRS